MQLAVARWFVTLRSSGVEEYSNRGLNNYQWGSLFLYSYSYSIISTAKTPFPIIKAPIPL